MSTVEMHYIEEMMHVNYVKPAKARLFFQERNPSSRNKESHTAFKIPIVHTHGTSHRNRRTWKCTEQGPGLS